MKYFTIIYVKNRKGETVLEIRVPLDEDCGEAREQHNGLRITTVMEGR